MTEGWHADEYLVLFDENEILTLTERYDLQRYIGGFRIIGLRGWDDFILQDAAGKLYTIPTVPIDEQHLKPLTFVIDTAKIRPDARFAGKVKWYVQPLVFGGDPLAKQNIAWIDFQQHAEGVRWWNQKYFEAKRA